MFSSIRRRFTYANVVMTLALLLAMSGGAYAAGKFVITSTKQISPKVLKQLKGKAGPAGPAGTVGPAGAAGPTGKEGAVGKEGTPGVNGKEGPNGVSVTSKTLAQGAANCKEGGSEFTAAENKKSYACNGSPWTAGGTLPSGKTETGDWSIAVTGAGEEILITSLSFTVPLTSGLDSSHVHFIKFGETPPTGCSGTVESPAASSGNLCVFAAAGMSTIIEDTPPIKAIGGEAGTDQTGAHLYLVSEAPGAFSALGTWAVTG